MRCRDESGFTLLEAAIALAIVSLVALAALEGVGAELRSVARMRQTLPAVALAEDRMALVRLLPPSQVDALPDSVASGRFPPPLDVYAWEIHTQAVRGEPNMYGITVQVTWPGGAFSLESRIYRPTCCVAIGGAEARP